MGDRLAAIAFPWLVWTSTHSAAGAGAVLALYTLPYLVFGAFAGVAADRVDKRKFMIAFDLVRVGLVLAVPLVAPHSLAAVFVLSFAIASAGVFFDTSKLSLLPEIVSSSQLLRANSLLSTTEYLTEILGPVAAGLLLAVVGTAAAFQVDAVTFAVSAAALLLMPYRAKARAAAERTARALWSELREGFRFLSRDRAVRANTVMSVIATAGVGAMLPLTFLFAVHVLHGGPRAFGTLEGAMGVGYFIGSVALVALANRVHKGWVMIAGLAVMGGCLALLAVTGSVWTAALPIVVYGVANAVLLIAVDTFLQQQVPEGLLGRVLGMRFTLTQGMYALSVLLGGALAAVVDVRVLFVVAGGIVFFSALVGLLSREVRES